ncbi:ribonuclease P protein subunit [Candidatus Micrarchaeota archaeon]|nr:ribonuclease P protein subunit [Candidatus Micrarchaeota archaeon]
MINKNNLFFSTFIGLPVEIVNSSQHSLVGVNGVIVDESKNLIISEIDKKTKKSTEKNKQTTEKKEIKIPKASSVFSFTTDSGEKVTVEGNKIAFRPHERPKKV